MTEVQFQDLDQTPSYLSLKQQSQTSIRLADLLTPERVEGYRISQKYLSFSFAASLVDDAILTLLGRLASEQQVIEKYAMLRQGKVMNIGENRPVLHHKTRSIEDRGDYGQEQVRIAEFAQNVRQGKITGYTGKAIRSVVQIGIGGSDLGPRAMTIALSRWAQQEKIDCLDAHFIANVDPDDVNGVVPQIDFETCLFVLVSKSGSTQETLTNLSFIQQHAQARGLEIDAFNRQLVCVTAKGSPLDQPDRYLDIFYMDDFIGGRFSSTSAVGGVVLSLVYGPEVFDRFLEGAGCMDAESQVPDPRRNMALLGALLGIWERNFLGYPSKAIIPYSEALSRFPAHLQQLDCESNGKCVNVRFEPVSYETGPLIFGEVGTSGQHSFFQKLHQGTDVIPIQFIGFSDPQMDQDIKLDGVFSQQKLVANLVAQIVAFSKGKPDSNENKAFGGNRPSSLVYAKRLTPEVLGALLAFYENGVMFQGFLWNINSFDQEGVQLGKVLTQAILQRREDADPLLDRFMSLLK